MVLFMIQYNSQRKVMNYIFNRIKLNYNIIGQHLLITKLALNLLLKKQFLKWLVISLQFKKITSQVNIRMNYILKEQMLQISQKNNRNTTVSHHFYQFQQKQQRIKAFQQQKNIQLFLQLIERQEQKLQQKQNKRQRCQITPNPFNKNSNKSSKNTFNYINNMNSQILNDQNNNTDNTQQNKFNKIQVKTKSSALLQKEKYKQKQTNFYQYNLKWKEKVQLQIQKQKKLKLEKQQKEDKENIKSYLEIGKDKENYWKDKKLNYQVSSKGPISGWYERFQHYVESRLPQDYNNQQQNQFNPKINEKSKCIASKMVGKVQDRLIKFGQIMKLKQQEMLIEEVQKIGKKHVNSTDHNYDSTWTNASQTFYRLYKDGQRLNRQRSQQIYQFSFKPKINQIPEEMQEKIKKKRQKKPLHMSNSKNHTNISKKVLQIYRDQSSSSFNGTKKSLFSKAPFDNFLKRNQNLLQKRQKTHKKKQFYDKQKQKIQQKQCTFSPVLNKKSIFMFQKVKQQCQNQEQYEYQDENYVQNQGVQQQYMNQITQQNNQQKYFEKEGVNQVQNHYRHRQNFPYFASSSKESSFSAIEIASSQKKFNLHKQSQDKNGDSLDFDDIHKFQMKTQLKSTNSPKPKSWQTQFDQLTEQLKGMITK